MTDLEERKPADVLGGAQTQLGRALHAPGWYVPGVLLREVNGESWLNWGFRDEKGQTVTRIRLASEAGGALDAFLKLRDADAQKILRFAKAWGVLGLCDHGKPFTHNHRVNVAAPKPFDRPCLPTYLESISRWRAWAKAAFEIVLATAGLLGEPALSQISPSERRQVATDRKQRWTRVIHRTQGWLRDSAVSWTLFGAVPRGKLEEEVMIEPRKLQLGAYCPMLFDVLAFQLAQTVTRSEGLYVCAGCNQPFFRAWHRTEGQRVFCRDCGTRASMRLYMREKRAKQNSRPEKEK